MINENILVENIVKEAYVANTFFKRFMGYMFRKEPHHKAIIFKPCNSIHTFFMRFNIDVLFIDENMEVIRKVENLRPWRMIPPVKGAKMVVECASDMSINQICRAIRDNWLL